MNLWELVSLVLLLALVPPILLIFRGGALDRLIALTQGSLCASLGFVTLAMATGRPMYVDVALAAALLSAAGSLAYARFLERWL
jgi:multicomponent Na+:H+ antiporter subunit F